MAQLEQLASTHDAFVELMRRLDRRVLLDIVRPGLELELPEVFEIRERTPTIEVPGFAKRARKVLVDLLLTVQDTERVRLILVVEYQSSWDATKQWDWTLFPAAFSAEARSPARVIVFSLPPELRARIRERLLSKVHPLLLLIEPDQIELITDYVDARRRPRETVLGAIYHVLEEEPLERRVAGIRAALVGMQTLGSFEYRCYMVLVLSITPESIATRALEQLREQGELDEGRLPELADFERESYLFHIAHEAGREAGHRDGQAATLRRTLVDILELRGFAVTAADLRRIDACDDLQSLERWYANARSLAADSSLDRILD